MRVSRSGGWTSVISPISKRLRRRSSRVAIAFGGPVGRDHDLLAAVVERVERVEELLLGLLAPLERLDVVDEEDVRRAVAVLEGADAAVAQGVDELVGERLHRDVGAATARGGSRRRSGRSRGAGGSCRGPRRRRRRRGCRRAPAPRRRPGRPPGRSGSTGPVTKASKVKRGCRPWRPARRQGGRAARLAGAARSAPAASSGAARLDHHLDLEVGAADLEERVPQQRQVALADPLAQQLGVDAPARGGRRRGSAVARRRRRTCRSGC